MSIAMMVFTFINVWFVSLFVVLPMGIERGAHDSPLDYEAAPKRIRWKKILLINTLLALAITATIALVIKTGIVPVK